MHACYKIKYQTVGIKLVCLDYKTFLSSMLKANNENHHPCAHHRHVLSGSFLYIS